MTEVVGRPVRRSEDFRLLTGAGRYTDDLRFEGESHAVVVRSPHAHARIRSIDTGRAARAPGVLGVFTSDDLVADGIKPLPSMSRDPRFAQRNRDGSEMADPPHWQLARGKVRHVGDPVALVVAERRDEARAAAELVEVAYEPLPALIDPAAALAPGAPAVHEDIPSNVCFEWECGDRKVVERAMRGAAHVVRLTLANNRQIVAFMEPRAAIGSYDPKTSRYMLHAGSQGPHRFRETIAYLYGVPQEQVRVVTGDVGGGFGPRGFFYPENALVPWAARKVGRIVRWTGERSEDFVTDLHSRDQLIACELGLDDGGRFLALRVSSDLNMGAYLAARALYAYIVYMGPIITGAYHFPAAYFEFRGVFTNTVPNYALRGIGRAEATYVLERLIEEAARLTGFDRVELRRRNLVPPSAMPYAAPGGAVYDSGAFERNMDLALALADWRGFAKRRDGSGRQGRLRGIGVANYVENAGGASKEYAHVAVGGDGAVTLSVGSMSTGQGHDTVFAQVAAERLGVAFEQVRVVSGDSDGTPTGGGTYASRSMRKTGAAVVAGAHKVIDKGRDLAGELLEATAADVEFAGGRFRVRGTDYSVGLSDVAKAAERRGEPLGAGVDHPQPEDTYPNGCHVAEVEVDPETGRVELLAHCLIKDVGRAINPLIVDGQLHGGIAQGVGQALVEHCVYDRASGQLLSGSFMDYAVPRADDLPALAVGLNEVPCAGNPLGVKGAGEGGATGSPPAVVNAVLDALAGLGVRHIDMPLTPERVWRAIRAATRPS